MDGGRQHGSDPTPLPLDASACSHPQDQLAAGDGDEVRQVAVVGHAPLLDMQDAAPPGLPDGVSDRGGANTRAGGDSAHRKPAAARRRDLADDDGQGRVFSLSEARSERRGHPRSSGPRPASRQTGRCSGPRA